MMRQAEATRCPGQVRCKNKNEETNVMLKEQERDYVPTKKGKPVEFAALSFDYLGGKDVMPVGGYWGPYRSGGEVRGHILPDLLCEQSFCDIADAGVNMIVKFNESADFNDDTDVCRELKYGEKYHIVRYTFGLKASLYDYHEPSMIGGTEITVGESPLAVRHVYTQYKS